MDVSLLLASRYLSAVAVSVFLWDYILTFYDEFVYVWKERRWSSSHICFLWNRYTTVIGLVYGAFLTSGVHSPLNNSICKGSYVTVTTLAIVATAATHGYIALRLFVLWDHRTTAKRILWSTFGVTFLGLTVSGIFAVKTIYHNASYSFSLGACSISKNPKSFMGVWASMLAFDLVTVVLVVSNALDQPYQQRSQVLERVKRDGALSFLAIVVASLVMLLVSVAGGPGSVFEVAFIAWAWDAIIVSRLVLRVESMNLSGLPTTIDRAVSKEPQQSQPPVNVYQMDVWAVRSIPS